MYPDKSRRLAGENPNRGQIAMQQLTDASGREEMQQGYFTVIK
jgi:hypothetical protein